jgi:Flp pilus assembly pilin Flp
VDEGPVRRYAQAPAGVDRTERGAALFEYALLVALIAVVCLFALTYVGTRASVKFSSVGSDVVGSAGGTAAPPAVVSVALSPVNASLATGATLQFTATGTNTDGSTADLSSTVTWTSSDPSVASINASGLVTGIGPGAVTITAVQGAVQSSTHLNVR